MANSASQVKESKLTLALERIDARIARDLRALRQARSLTLTQISESIGRSVGWLSQVERGISMPTFADLSRLADTFGVPMSLFVSREAQSEPEMEVVVRAGARRTLGPTEAGLEEKLLSPALGGSFEMRHRTFAPGASSSQKSVRDAEEAGYVLSGTIDIEVDGTWHMLHAGDSFRFKGKSIRWRNDGDAEAVVIWVLSPPVY
ncbi:cupin domain-containing protein [Mesorhizobium sp. Z1-4]|uniref:helix-turn-helix domain-containing protein n=1 Tax=Mesorhizobium sp. Z1-4 TaxID=2448478 RepID=UPI000FD76FC3|nr:cupin domain-containing protein [Mesorhizobium sp. Z1-4]